MPVEHESDMSKIKSIWFPSITFLLLIPSLVLHAYRGSFSRFLGDDYCSAFWANRFGVFRATWYWYLTWSGRYSASFLDSIFGILGPKIVPIVTFSVITIWVVSIVFAFIHIFPEIKAKNLSVKYALDSTPDLEDGGLSIYRLKSKLYIILLAVGVLYLTLNFTPHVQQSLYWGQGMRSVVPPLILGTVYTGIFITLKDANEQKSSRIFWYLLGFFLTFVSGGFSETYCVVQIIAIGFALVSLILIFRYPARKFALIFLFFGFLGAVLSLITILVAPGNASRAAFFPPPPDLLGMLEISALSFLGYFWNLFSSIESIAGFLGIFLLSSRAGFIHVSPVHALRNLSVVSVGGLLLLFSCFPPAAYALSDAPPGRTLIIGTYILAMLVVLSGYYFGGYLSSRKLRIPQFLTISYLVVIFVSLLASSILVCKKIYASRQEYIDFAESWDKTHETLLLLKDNADDVIVPAVIDNWSGVLRMADNPRFYVNECASNYYGFNSIVARDDLPPTKP